MDQLAKIQKHHLVYIVQILIQTSYFVNCQ